MIVKRTKVVTTIRGAMAWAQAYIAEERKHKGEDYGELGMGLGKKYYTSRPVGALTAHGYAKLRVDALALSRNLKGNDAVIVFLREHCRRRTLQRKKILGIRLFLRLDPAKTVELAMDLVDIDRLLVRCIEGAFGMLERAHYPGDRMGYILGIRHDAVAETANQPGRPHIRANVLVLPQTENGIRISLTHQAQPGRDGRNVDLLDAIHLNYQAMADEYTYNIKAAPRVPPSKEWVALVKECAGHALEDAFEGPDMEPVKGRKFTLDKFSYYATTSDRENIRLRFIHRMDQLIARAAGTIPARWKEYDERQTVTEAAFCKRVTDHTTMLAKGIKEMRAVRNHEVKIWAFDPPKALLLQKPTRLIGNRKDQIKALFDDLEMKRYALRVNLVGECALQEMELSVLNGLKEIPDWIKALGQISSGKGPMPNQDIFRSEKVAPRTPAAASPVVAPAAEPAAVPPAHPAKRGMR